MHGLTKEQKEPPVRPIHTQGNVPDARADRDPRRFDEHGGERKFGPFVSLSVRLDMMSVLRGIRK